MTECVELLQGSVRNVSIKDKDKEIGEVAPSIDVIPQNWYMASFVVKVLYIHSVNEKIK